MAELERFSSKLYPFKGACGLSFGPINSIPEPFQGVAACGLSPISDCELLCRGAEEADCLTTRVQRLLLTSLPFFYETENSVVQSPCGLLKLRKTSSSVRQRFGSSNIDQMKRATRIFCHARYIGWCAENFKKFFPPELKCTENVPIEQMLSHFNRSSHFLNTHPVALSHSLVQREEQRLAALESLGLLDTEESESFDRITRLASFFFGAPISAMSLTDRSRQWFKSYHGVDHREIPREGAPCAEVTESQKVLHIPNLLHHERYQNCPLAQAGIRFYAGAPLTTRQGHTLGAFCVLDSKPRELSREQLLQLQDMAAMVMSQVELQHEFGRVDPVSGLANRHQLAADLEDADRLHKEASRVLLLIEIADLRHINEFVSVLGSTYLEELLKSCAARIRAALRKSTVLYHVGFAAFALVLDILCDPWDEVIDIISDAIRTPIEIGGGAVSVTAGYGIAPFDARTDSAADAIRMASSAVHEARENDVPFAVYDEASHAAHQRRFSILRCLRESLARDEHFALVYQPRVNAATGRCVGSEALLRWSHPELGNVSPGEFIPLVEQTSLAGLITRWVVTSAFAQVSKWRSLGKVLRVSINVSARNLEEPHFAEQIASAMSLYGIQATEIELEFTESAVIRHEKRVHHQLQQLRQLGIELAIDDFGTGYSSFSYLQKLPAQVVKLDRSFIENIGIDEKGVMLVGAMIRMSHDLGYRVVAEGVETPEALELLRSLQCDEIQGYVIAQPMTVSAFERFLSNRSPESNLGAFTLSKSGEILSFPAVA